MDRVSLNRLFVVIAAIVVIGPAEPVRNVRGEGVAAQQETSGSPRADSPLTILQINDVYSTVPVDGAGGLARVATLKQQMAAAGRTPFLVLAGDFLSPSVASTVFKGEQMIAALNAAGVDMATLGNHEFDFGTDILKKRMAEARFQWVISNVVDTETGKPIGGAQPYVVRTFGTLKVGFIGLCLTTDEISIERLTGARRIDPIQATARYLPVLKREGATVIVAITHLAFADDRRLAQRFPDIDLIVGGHEHYPITATEDRTLISKAGSDARWVARIDVNRPLRGPTERFFELIPITAALPDDRRTVDAVISYEKRLGPELDTVVGVSRVALDAESTMTRATETNLGNLSADAMRADVNADVALINSGGIRGDRFYKEGPLTRRTLIAIHPFTNVVCKIALNGEVLLQALNHGVAKVPASAGQFPQVSGIVMRVDAKAPAGNRVRDVRINGERLDPAKTYTAAIPDYVLKGGDGYTMLANQRVIVGPESGNLIVTALEKYIAAKREVAPMVEGRIVIER